MDLDLSSLERSIAFLDQALAVHTSVSGDANDALRATVRAGVIQTFKVCYERCWKFIQRWLAMNPTPDIASQLRTRRDLFRHAAHAGLINDAALWFAYGQACDATFHTYQAEVAERVALLAKNFCGEAHRLLSALQQHNG